MRFRDAVTLPRPLLVLAVLLGGIALIILANPPHTVCQSQLEVLKKSQTPFLFADSTEKFKSRTGYQKAVEVCQYGNSPGGCFDFFNGMRKLQKDLEAVPSECGDEVGAMEGLSGIMQGGIDLMLKLAWGDKVPSGYLDRQGWFDNFHLAAFCGMKRVFVQFYGESKWTSFREEKMRSLPGASALSRRDQWERSLFSVPCERLAL